MLYPLKFKPVYKDYIWGGRNLEKLNKVLPEGKIAESWEIACHKDGMSIVCNGNLAGSTLEEIISKYSEEILGHKINNKNKFPLLAKFIDANDWLSVQVHPDDDYARVHENGENGKSEMWYIISAKPGSKLVYGLKQGINKETFLEKIKANNIENCLNFIEVSEGDIIDIPPGMIHAIGGGIVLAEIQQSSNITYRVYDYDRVDKNGNKRELHINKAIEVVSINSPVTTKTEFKKDTINENCTRERKISNKYFKVDLYNIDGSITETTDGSKFYIYMIVEGEGQLKYRDGFINIKLGDSIFIPASLGDYNIKGNLKTLKAYVAGDR